MRTRVLFVVVLAVLGLASCRMTRLAKTNAGKPLATANNADFTVIGTMQNRDRVVTVKTGPSGIVYSIATKDGQSLYENISGDKLKAEAPALHQFIETGTAGYAGMGWTDAIKPRMEPQIDARILMMDASR
jgi:hypothetical protein